MRIARALVTGTWIAAASAFAAELGTEDTLAAERKPIFSGFLTCEVSSAYLGSSGDLADIYPVIWQELDWFARLGRFGYLYGYAWIGSSLHDHQHDIHRELFHEFEGVVQYGYDVDLPCDMKLVSLVGALWDPLIGYPDESNAWWGPSVEQSLENPIVTPYYNALWTIDPEIIGRVRLGLRRLIPLSEHFSVKPCVETIWYDGRRYRFAFGEEPRQPFLGGAFATGLADLRLNWHLTPQLTLYGAVRQYLVLGGQARAAVRALDDYWARTELTIGAMGVEYSF